MSCLKPARPVDRTKHWPPCPRSTRTAYLGWSSGAAAYAMMTTSVYIFICKKKTKNNNKTYGGLMMKSRFQQIQVQSCFLWSWVKTSTSSLVLPKLLLGKTSLFVTKPPKSLFNLPKRNWPRSPIWPMPVNGLDWLCHCVPLSLFPVCKFFFFTCDQEPNPNNVKVGRTTLHSFFFIPKSSSDWK